MSRYDWGQRHPGIDRLEEQISEARDAVIAHPMYAALDNHRAIRTFQEHHVFAVWDFMSLLKSLQRNLTCVAKRRYTAMPKSVSAWARREERAFCPPYRLVSRNRFASPSIRAGPGHRMFRPSTPAIVRYSAAATPAYPKGSGIPGLQAPIRSPACSH